MGMACLSFHTYRLLTTLTERDAFREDMHGQGYYAFYAFVEEFRSSLKSYAEEEMEVMGSLLARGRADFPNPARFSPSWDKLWDEFEQVYRAKNQVLSSVATDERSGEWQVLLDNPYLPQQVVCYPNLAFVEAAYMYAYFQKDLKPNEILRLQKVTRILRTSGSKEVSIFPDV
jgi:hypothetical protein